MTQILSPEQALSPEAAALQELDATVQRIFTEYQPEPVEPSPNQPASEGVVDEVWHWSTGASVERTRLPNGAVTYKHKSLWHSIGDGGKDIKGEDVSSWSEGGNGMTVRKLSQEYGALSETAASARHIDTIRKSLEATFPKVSAPSRKLSSQLGNYAFRG